MRAARRVAGAKIAGWFRMMECGLQRGAVEVEESQCVGMAKT